MRTYLYTGANRPQDLIHLAVGVAGLRLPVLVASFGPTNQNHPLVPHARTLPIEIVSVRLPGLGLPRTDTPADEVVTATALSVLRQIIAAGEYRLVILDSIRQATELGLLDVSDLRNLARCASDKTELAMT